VAEPAIEIAVAERLFPGETVSGDAWQVDRHGDTQRVTVIDGLGHGRDAAAAARAAKEVLAAHPELSAVDALRACHRALHATRGAAMWIGSLDVAGGVLTYAGIGNVEARLLQVPREHRLPSQRGIVGAVLPTLRGFEEALAPGWVLVVHTDGVRDHFDRDALADLALGDPQSMADGILATWGRHTDDALVLVARSG
jgi:serine phosphatase RsbU (regulator of sigma subunit)